MLNFHPGLLLSRLSECLFDITHVELKSASYLRLSPCISNFSLFRFKNGYCGTGNSYEMKKRALRCIIFRQSSGKLSSRALRAIKLKNMRAGPPVEPSTNCKRVTIVVTLLEHHRYNCVSLPLILGNIVKRY